jgi:hypothetical protein
MGLTNSRVVQTPEFLQPNVRRQSQLTPNIRLGLLISSLTHLPLRTLRSPQETLDVREDFPDGLYWNSKCQFEVLTFRVEPH